MLDLLKFIIEEEFCIRFDSSSEKSKSNGITCFVMIIHYYTDYSDLDIAEYLGYKCKTSISYHRDKGFALWNTDKDFTRRHKAVVNRFAELKDDNILFKLITERVKKEVQKVMIDIKAKRLS